MPTTSSKTAGPKSTGSQPSRAKLKKKGRIAKPKSSEPNHSEPNHSEPNHSEPNHSEPNHSEPNHSEPNHSEPNHSGSTSNVAARANAREKRTGKTGRAATVGETTRNSPKRTSNAASSGAPSVWSRLRQSDWWHVGLFAFPAYIASRLCVLAGASVVAAELRVDANIAAQPNSPSLPDIHGPSTIGSALRPIVDVMTSWDGKWYMELVRLGYPRSVPPNITYFQTEARSAFFPTFPILARWVDRIVPGGDVAAALFLNAVLGLVAVVLIGVLGSRVFSPRVGRLAAVLVAIFPGSFVFSFAYSEALMMVLAATALLALWEERWFVAGVFAALTTATRPNGVAMVVACLVAAYPAVRKRHEWRALIAPAMAPLGFILYQWWLGAHTSERTVWFRVQRQAWDEGASFGWTAIRNTFEAFAHPLTSPTDTITAVTVIATIALVWMTLKSHLPRFMSAYAFIVIALMLVPATVTARPRFLFTAFPLLIGAAWWLDSWRQRHEDDIMLPLTYLLCGAGLVALTGLYGVYGAIP